MTDSPPCPLTLRSVEMSRLLENTARVIEYSKYIKDKVGLRVKTVERVMKNTPVD